MAKSNVAIYYSNSYSLEERIQSEDRIEHPIKKSSLLFIDLITKNTVDEDVIKTLKIKNLDSKFFQSKLLENLIKRRELNK